jgi:hypothetical protein
MRVGPSEPVYRDRFQGLPTIVRHERERLKG